MILGARSDYYVTVPRHCSFDDSVSMILRKLENISDTDPSPSPLIYRDKAYPGWDESDEKIYRELYNDFKNIRFYCSIFENQKTTS